MGHIDEGWEMPDVHADHIHAQYIKATSQQDIIHDEKTKPNTYSVLDNTTPEDHIDHGCSFDPKLIADVMADQIVWVELLSPNKVSYEIQNIPNQQALRILLEILPKTIELYLKKSRDYGGNVMENPPGGDLGVKACFPDMWRKMGKLRVAIWDGQELHGEQPEEILMDLIGHILITLDKLRG